MRHVTPISTFTFALLVCQGAWGAPDGPQAPLIDSKTAVTAAKAIEVIPTPENAPDGSQIVSLTKGALAPFTGLLVPEARYVELLKAENRAQELAVKLTAHERTAELVEAVYLRKLEQATAPIPWYEGATFNRWLGFGLGLVTTGLVVWGAIEVTQELR